VTKHKTEAFLETSEHLLRSGLSVRFRAGGQSMHPTIRDGEMITVEPVVPESIHRGDIVLYRSRKGVIAHRIVRIETEDATLIFTPRGDAMLACDARIKGAEILGRVVAVERERRRIHLAGSKARWGRRARQVAGLLKAKMKSVLFGGH
jgi:signal peptidase I